MTQLSAAEVARLALGAGLSADRAATAVAIAKSESGFRTDAVGDVAIQDKPGGTWGPSIGLWQIRSLQKALHTGGPRDASQLMDGAFNARSMVAISSGGTSWSPWSVYKSGAYRANLTMAKAAVKEAQGGGSSTKPIPGKGGPNDQSGDLGIDWSGAPVDAPSVVPGASGVTSTLSALEAAGKLLGKLLDPAFWMRLGLGAIGVVGIVGGVLVVFRDTKLGAMATDAAMTAGKAAALA